RPSDRTGSAPVPRAVLRWRRRERRRGRVARVGATTPSGPSGARCRAGCDHRPSGLVTPQLLVSPKYLSLSLASHLRLGVVTATTPLLVAQRFPCPIALPVTRRDQGQRKATTSILLVGLAAGRGSNAQRRGRGERSRRARQARSATRRCGRRRSRRRRLARPCR